LTSEGAMLDPIIAAAGQPQGESSVPPTAAKLGDLPAPTMGEDWPCWRGPR